jgi:hypothetical protein
MRKNKHFCDVILHVRTSVGRWVELLWRFQYLFVVVMGHSVAFSLFSV